MRSKRYAWFGVVVVALVVLHEVLLRVLAREHVAHALLGASNAMPPLVAVALGAGFLVLRFVVIVVLPGALPFVAARYVFRAVRERNKDPEPAAAPQA